MTPFYTTLTNYGKTALAEALAAQQPLKIPHMAVGDGGGEYYEPTEAQTNLRNELWRGNLNDLRTDDDIQGQVIAEAIIPMGIEGDWTVREIGLYDESGQLIAVGKYPETYIPPVLSGAKTQVHISIIIKIDNVAAVELIVSHDQVLASKLFVLKKGYGTVGSFEAGLSFLDYLTHRFQLVYFEKEATFYHWTGGFPKLVPANSTPLSLGGFGDGAWVRVGDKALHCTVNELASGAYANVSLGTHITLTDRVNAIFMVCKKGTYVADGYAVIDIGNNKVAVVYAPNNRINVLWCGATGGLNDQTAAIQSALNYGQTLRNDAAFELYLPLGEYRVTHITCDLSKINRFVKFIGPAIPSDLAGAKLIFTESATRDISMQWDGGFCAENVVFDFVDARNVGTLASPRWGIDIRNTALANSTSDLDCNFDNCTFMNFHRGIRCYGRGIIIRGGSVLAGGGAVSEGCLLDIDFPNPLEPGDNPEQTLVTGMRAFMVAPDRVHACTGWLVRNKGYNANNIQQLTIKVGMSDTFMGWVRGAVKNFTLEGGTYLYPVSTMLYVEDGFDCDNVAIKAPTLIGMPESNIGASKNNGLSVTEEEVMNFSVGVLLYVSPNAGVTRNFSWRGGVISDARSELFQIAKAIDGFSFTEVTCSNLCKENKSSSGTTRHVINFNSTASKNVLVKNNIVKMLPMNKTGALVGNASNITDYVIQDNLLSGAIYENYTRPKDADFGGDYSSVYCGQYTGDGSVVNTIRYTAKRYAKCAMVSQITGASSRTWMVKDGDVTSDVLLSGGVLITKNAAALKDAIYTFTLFY